MSSKLLAKYRQEDGSLLDENGVWHGDSAVEFIQGAILKFCGCGLPDENVRYIRDALALVDWNRQSIRDQEPEHGWTEYRKRCTKLFNNHNAEYFMWYWLDMQGYVEHGSSLPGWLSESGEELLEAMNEAIEEAGG